MNIKRIVVGYLNTNCYILENELECIIIDPGSDINKIKAEITKKVVGILITHNHFDHVGALEDLEKLYGVVHSDYYNLKEGLNTISSFSFIVKYNLGHTMDSISYIFNDNMFSGDFLFEDGIGRCDLGGDFELMKNSIKEILKSNINYKLFPGHGDSVYLNDIKDSLKEYL